MFLSVSFQTNESTPSWTSTVGWTELSSRLVDFSSNDCSGNCHTREHLDIGVQIRRESQPALPPAQLNLEGGNDDMNAKYLIFFFVLPRQIQEKKTQH